MKRLTLNRRWRTLVVVAGLALWLAWSSLPAGADNGTPLPDQVALPPDQAPPIAVQVQVHPAVVSPGDPLTFTVHLTNSGPADRAVSVSATLPDGVTLPVEALPAGTAYNMRAGRLHWSGLVPATSTTQLVWPGLAPAESRADGQLTLLLAVDGGGEVAEPIRLSASAWAGTPPLAAMDYTGQENGPFHLFNQSLGTGPLRIWWDFGDGTVSTEANPVHTFLAGGDYAVRLVVANPGGIDSAVRTVRVARSAEPAERPTLYPILVSDDSPAVGQEVEFGSPAEPVLVSIHWNLGDGTVSGEQNPVHAYQQPGFYLVTRLLGEGVTAIQSSRIVVVGEPPSATIAVDRWTAAPDELLTFTALASTPGASYFWDLGDGNTATHDRVAHSYRAAGTYLVTLAVSNDFGVTQDTLTLNIASHLAFFPLVANQATLTSTIAAAGESIDAGTPEEQAALQPLDPLAQEILQAINTERQAVGLAPLAWSDQLARSAQHHTDDMATNWFTGHYGSEGSRPIDRMRQASYTGDYAGECTAWGFGDLASAFAWWMTSPPHRVIILSTVATEVGGGYTYNPDSPSVRYWTLDFGAR